MKGNIMGSKYGKLTILEVLPPIIDNSGSKRIIVKAACDCGNIVEKKLKYLKSGETKTCGKCLEIVVGSTDQGDDIILSEVKNGEDILVGSKFNRLTVTNVGFVAHKSTSKRYVEAVCDCGKRIFLDKWSVVTGHTSSCGCYAVDMLVDRVKTHGLCKSKTYTAWCNMKNRCMNPKTKGYANYGGRGISFCESWQDFDKFLQDMGEAPDGLTLERIDVNGNYCKDNCTWATRSEQSINRRKLKTNKSGKTGVHVDLAMGKWKASITVNYKREHLGYFDDIEDAISVRKEAELKYFGFNKE